MPTTLGGLVVTLAVWAVYGAVIVFVPCLICWALFGRK